MFNVGDRVIIRPWEALIQEGGYECTTGLAYEYIRSEGSNLWFNREMRGLCGRVSSIATTYSNDGERRYRIKDNHWSYIDNFLRPESEKAYKIIYGTHREVERFITEADRKLLLAYYESRGFIYSKLIPGADVLYDEGARNTVYIEKI